MALRMLNRFIAFEKSKKIYAKCKMLRVPEHLSEQLLRASSSISLNLAEGWAKKPTKDRERFFTIALGSLRECRAILALEFPDEKELGGELDELGAILYTLAH